MVANKYLMRPEHIKNQIVKNFSAPISLEQVISPDDISRLVAFFYDQKNKIHKNTGPITVNISSDDLEKDPFNKIIQTAKSILGEFEITAAFFFYTEYPHIIHNDDTFELPIAYKGINVPLVYQGGYSHPWLCFFHQYYLEGPAKFFRNDSNIVSYYNTPVYDYSKVENLTDVEIPEPVRLKYLTHLKKQWLEGLSFDCALPWKPGNMLIFDSVQLHCASDFRKQGIQSKLGISIFTKLNGDVEDEQLP